MLKENHSHDKHVRELVFSNSGGWFLKLRELISETPGVVFWNSGSCTFSIRLVLRTTPGVALKELRELHWGAMWWFFSWRSRRICERRRMRQWQPKRSTWMLWISRKKETNDEKPKCGTQSLHYPFWGMWERVNESRVGLQEVNVTNRESTKRGHTCQWTLAKDVQLFQWVCSWLEECRGNAAGGGGIREVKQTQTPEENTILELAPHKQPKRCKGRFGNHPQKTKFSQTFVLQTSTVLWIEPLWEGRQNHRQGSIEPLASNLPFLGYPFKILPTKGGPGFCQKFVRLAKNEVLLGQESCRTKVSRIFRIFVPNFAPNFAPNFPRIFQGFFVLRFVGDGDQKKFTKNPRHFPMQNSQANTRKCSLNSSGEQAKMKFWMLEWMKSRRKTRSQPCMSLCVYVYTHIHRDLLEAE